MFCRFLDAYKSNGVPIWGLTTQNEPTDGLIPWFTFNCMGFTPQMMRDFIKLDLGPALAAANYGPDQLKLIIMDDQLLFVQAWADAIYRDSEAARYVSGLGFHWYLNNWSPLIALDETIKTYPNYFLLATEACEGSSPFDFQKVSLGNWKRAESYANDIITVVKVEVKSLVVPNSYSFRLISFRPMSEYLTVEHNERGRD